jgi:tetratricopeptide (TPR) repeat protein
MSRVKAAAAMVVAVLVLVLGAQAQNFGRLSGTVYDENGKPWPGVTVTLTNKNTGQKYTVTTDSHGEYVQMGIQPGIYTVDFATDRFPVQEFEVRIAVGEQRLDLNFQELLKKNPQYLEQQKKEEEAKKKFAELKAHFDAGRKAIEQIDELRKQLAAQPPDQRAQTQQQIAQLSQTAITELEQAEQVAGPTSINLPVILGNLGVAYEAAGKHAEAAEAFRKASELRPNDPNYYLGIATNLAYTGKLDDAGQACDKLAALAPASAATCWRNIGVVLFNQSRLKEAIAPLRKAASLDPNNADTWYLLGNALMNTMESRMEGGKLVAVVDPQTPEAYQKYLQLAPNGPHAAEAQQALEVLKQLGAGVSTRVEVKKKH